MPNADSLLLVAPFAVDKFLAAAGDQKEADIAIATSQGTAIATAGTPTEARPGLGYSLDRGVAVVAIEGGLERHSSYGFFTGSRYALGYDDIAAAVDAAAADPRVKGIMLSINSPGGVVAGCKELADHIASVAASKPMAAYADGLCASAAFWLASATGTVYAPRTATVGSIGVIMVHADVSKANDRVGVKYTYITGGKFKATGNADGPLSDEDREYMQGRVASLHAIFRADVSARLGLDLAKAEEWGDGQVFVDTEARERGLVTHTVSGLQEAVNRLALEVTMDKTQLAAQHPELLAELEQEAAAAQAAAVEAARADARNEMLAWVEQIAGAEARGKIETVISAGVSPEQYKTLAGVLGQAQPVAQITEKQEDDAKAKILAGLEAATPAPLPGANADAAVKDDTRAAIDRMAAM